MARPAKPGWERFNVKLPEDLVKRLDAQAEKEERSRSELLADGAERYLLGGRRRNSGDPVPDHFSDEQIAAIRKADVAKLEAKEKGKKKGRKK